MSNERKKELVVSAIDNGTVIDHIPANEIYKVVKILNLDKYNDEVLIGTNLSSKKFGKKGIIKVKNKFFEETEVNKISLVAPNATLIVIKDYEVVEKIQLTIPKEIKKIVKSTLDSMGMVDALTKVGDFWLDMEYLLWTIERDDPKYGHLKINTIKVATAIAPKSYFERDDKIYYSVHTSKDFKKYIKLIDKTAVSKMKDKWGEMGYETLQDGYRLLHQYL